MLANINFKEELSKTRFIDKRTKESFPYLFKDQAKSGNTAKIYPITPKHKITYNNFNQFFNNTFRQKVDSISKTNLTNLKNQPLTTRNIKHSTYNIISNNYASGAPLSTRQKPDLFRNPEQKLKIKYDNIYSNLANFNKDVNKNISFTHKKVPLFLSTMDIFHSEKYELEETVKLELKIKNVSKKYAKSSLLKDLKYQNRFNTLNTESAISNTKTPSKYKIAVSASNIEYNNQEDTNKGNENSDYLCYNTKLYNIPVKTKEKLKMSRSIKNIPAKLQLNTISTIDSNSSSNISFSKLTIFSKMNNNICYSKYLNKGVNATLGA